MDESYIKVRGRWNYLSRAVDKHGLTVDFLLSKHRDIAAARRFFTRAVQQHAAPTSITLDGYPATHSAVTELEESGVLRPQTKVRKSKYLNNLIEQDHRFVKKKVRASQCFKSFHSAERTLEGIEAMNMMRKGQIKSLAGSDARGEALMVANLFGVAA